MSELDKKDIEENNDITPTDEAADVSVPESDCAQEAVAISPQKGNIFSGLVDYVELFVVAVAMVLLIFSVFFRTCTVDGDSMKPTLLNEEVLVVSDFAYTPEREDIIVFHQTGKQNMPLVKRVIGIGGDTITINFKDWSLTITDKNGNEVTLDESYAYVDQFYPHTLSYINGGTHTFVVPEDSLFVLGDNRNHSMDSTDKTNIGFVDQRRVLGKVLFRISPISEFGGID